jgi:hypothetical protein
MDSFESFKAKLDKVHKWPSSYIFKFVVPIAKADEVKAMFVKETLRSKLSKAGNYESFTMEKIMDSSDEVIDIYREAKKIEGLIVL